MNRRISASIASALLLACMAPDAFAQPRPAQGTAVDATRLTAAQQRMERGLGLFDRNDFTAALTEFRASLELYPSPNTRLYVGLCLLRLGHLADAHAELFRTYNEARDRAVTDPNYTDARDVSQHELEQLRPRLAELVLRAPSLPAGVNITANETEILPAMVGIALPFDPGELVVTARAPGFREFRRTVRLSAGTATEVSVALERDPNASTQTATAPRTTTDPHPIEGPRGVEDVRPIEQTRVSAATGGGVRTAGFVVGGVGLASLAGFAAFGLLAGSTYNDLVTECSPRCNTSAQRERIDQGQSYQLLSTVALGVGGALTLAGVLMIALGGPHVEDAPRAGLRVRPWFDASRATMGVGGVF